MNYVNWTSTAKWTKRICLWTTIGLIAWDCYVMFNGVDGDTISEEMRHWNERWPEIGFAWGVLMGHWFWPKRIKVTNA